MSHRRRFVPLANPFEFDQHPPWYTSAGTQITSGQALRRLLNGEKVYLDAAQFRSLGSGAGAESRHRLLNLNRLADYLDELTAGYAGTRREGLDQLLLEGTVSKTNDRLVFSRAGGSATCLFRDVTNEPGRTLSQARQPSDLHEDIVSPRFLHEVGDARRTATWYFGPPRPQEHTVRGWIQWVQTPGAAARARLVYADRLRRQPGSLDSVQRGWRLSTHPLLPDGTLERGPLYAYKGLSLVDV